MNDFYIGTKRIDKIHVKTRVNTDYITATASDIVSGKKSIDKDYNEITGTMVIDDSIVDLTADATAIAADITKDKTTYVNGEKITGTAIRPTPKDFINGVIQSYKVANNNIISPGDFVKFVDEVNNTGYKTADAISTTQLVKNGSVSGIDSYVLSNNKILLVFAENTTKYLLTACILNMTGTTATISDFVTFGSVTASKINICPISGNRFVILYNPYNSFSGNAIIIGIDNSDIITQLSDEIVFNVARTAAMVSLMLPGDRIFVSYTSGNVSITYGLLTINNDNTITSTMAIPRDEDVYATSIRTILMTENKVLIAYQPNRATSVQLRILDISDLTNLKYGPIYYNGSSLQMYAMDMVKVADNFVALTYYISGSLSGTPYLYLLESTGLTINATSMQINFSGSSINNMNAILLANNVIGLVIAYNNIIQIMPITITSRTTATIGSIYQLTHLGYTIISSVNYEGNKICVFFNSANTSNRDINFLLTEYINGTFSNIIKVPTDEPITETMVALALGNDEIAGVSDKYGEGRLYGGDTIDIIVPEI